MMTDDDDETAANLLAVIELYDALPEHCRTQTFWQRLKALCDPDLFNTLQSRQGLDNG